MAICSTIREESDSPAVSSLLRRRSLSARFACACVVPQSDTRARQKMTAVPAFLVQNPCLHSSHALAGSWCSRAPSIISDREQMSKHAPRWLPLLKAEQQDEMGDGMELIKPSLEQSLDAIDDVYMDRLPGEGER